MTADSKGGWGESRDARGDGPDDAVPSRWDLPATVAAGRSDAVLAYLRRGGEPNSVDENGVTALMYACRGGHVDLARAFIAAGVDLNALDADAATALIYAARRGDLEIVCALVEAGADVNWRASDEMLECMATPLLIAGDRGHGAVYDYLDPRTALEERRRAERVLRFRRGEGDGRVVALIRAASEGHLEAVRGLLAAGVDVDAADEQGATALITAAAYGHDPVVQALLEAGADPELPTDEGVRPLECAADAESIRLLVAAGADPDRVNDYGCLREQALTPLIAAANRGAVEAVRGLLEAGAAVDRANPVGVTPLMRAAAATGPQAADILDLLLAAGADSNAATVGGITPLDEALVTGNVAAVRRLLAAGADPEIRDHSGRTALMRAAEGRQPNAAELVAALIDAGARVDARDGSGRTALMSAVRRAVPALIRRLLAAGADAHAVDSLDYE